jgi:hypothetical protein
MKKVFIFFMAIFPTILRAGAESLKKLSDENAGPGQFYYQAYWHQPWRLSAAPIHLMELSGYLFLACCVLWFYNRFRKSRS